MTSFRPSSMPKECLRHQNCGCLLFCFLVSSPPLGEEIQSDALEEWEENREDRSGRFTGRKKDRHSQPRGEEKGQLYPHLRKWERQGLKEGGESQQHRDQPMVRCSWPSCKVECWNLSIPGNGKPHTHGYKTHKKQKQTLEVVCLTCR